ncbi:MAG: DUF2399 domain-containing protein [Lachnospiraceae bacterium]|nr:DUF2399 domain-containing protein [Lachnospiraceae bacterium]
MNSKKKTKKQKVTIQTVGQWLINKVDTPEYRSGKVTGKKHPKKQELLDGLVKEGILTSGQMLEQVRALERAGLIVVSWTSVNSDFKGITFPVENMQALCKYEKIKNPNLLLQEIRECIERYDSETKTEWLHKYYRQVLLRALEKGNIPENTKDENLFKVLNALGALENDIWKRKFSSDVLNDSKIFENLYENKTITILRNYSPRVIDEMEDYQVLAEHHILNYSQTLEWKGAITYRIQNSTNPLEQTTVNTTGMFYGTTLNAQTLTNAVPISLMAVKKVITIENKANYENMTYDPKILYIYVHGFLSPKERAFLTKLEKVADESVEFYHWSDLDYGGIRIFQFMKKNVFQNVKPLYMDRKTYEDALQKGAGIPIEVNKLVKIKEIDAGELEELKQCILQYGKEIEQENLIDN